MKIRFKLILYFGILLILCFGVAAVLTQTFMKNAINRLVFSNVVEMNKTITDNLDGSSLDALLIDFETVQEVTGVEILVYEGNTLIHSTFEVTPELSTAYVASQAYQVNAVHHQDQIYYYTSEVIPDSPFTVLVFRGENLALKGDLIYFAAFIGIVFLVISVTTVSFFTTRSFTHPIKVLAGYANRLNPEAPPESKPEFNTVEFNELGTALEKASIRLYDYHQNEQEFLHNFSHEMKSPLTNIYGYAEAMYYHVLSDEETKSACGIIMNESEKLKETINQILLLGRLDSAPNSFHFEKTSLIDVIGDALNSVSMIAKEAGIELKFDNTSKDQYLLGDSERLETAFVNILTNAIRYAKSTVEITMMGNTETLTIIFDDDGCGIPVSEREKVFERYYIGKRGHTGLGLTITKTVIDGHKGTISIEDSPTGGARFLLKFNKWIPLEKTDHEGGKPLMDSKNEKKKLR